jgi:hypothetical protein
MSHLWNNATGEAVENVERLRNPRSASLSRARDIPCCIVAKAFWPVSMERLTSLRGYAVIELESNWEAFKIGRCLLLHRIRWPEFEEECEIRPVGFGV